MEYIFSTLKWVFNKTISYPLEVFYFVGPIWKNKPLTEICYEITGVDSSWWNGTSDRTEECFNLLSRRFDSFNVTVYCTLYFMMLTFGVGYLCCRCLILNPFLTEIKKLTNSNINKKNE